MAEITINGVKYTNVPNKKAGTKFAASLTQSNIGASQAVQDYVNSAYFYPLVNAIDINWNGVEVDENSYINTTSDLISYIASKESNVDLSSYATMAYVDQKITDLIGGAPETLDTLKELADALADDASLAYVTQALDGKADKSSLTNYATNSYVTTELDKKADKSQLPDLTPYVSYTQANSYYAPKTEQAFYNLTEAGVGICIAYTRPPHATNYIASKLNTEAVGTVSSNSLIISDIEQNYNLNLNLTNTIIGGALYKPNPVDSQYVSTYLSDSIAIGSNITAYWMQSENIYKPVTNSLILGENLVSRNSKQLIVGKWNECTYVWWDRSNPQGQTMFAVGNGSKNARHNAFEVRDNGDIYIADTKNGTPYRLQDRLDMSSYVPMTSYNALYAEVQHLAYLISYYHPTPEPTPTPTFEGYWTYNGMRTDSLTISTSDPNMTLSFVSNPTIASGIGTWNFYDMPSSGVTINSSTGEMTINPSLLSEGSVYSGVGYMYQNNGESTSFYITITVTSSTPTKRDPYSEWTVNGMNYHNSISVSPSQGLTTLTFSGYPASGWTFTDPMISGITVDTSTGSITVDPTNASPDTYYVSVSYPGDATYNSYSGTFTITVESGKQSAIGNWYDSNNVMTSNKAVIAGDSRIYTFTFQSTPASGWTFSDPMMTGITVDQSNGTITIDPHGMPDSAYPINITASYMEDSSYWGSMASFSIRVLPEGSNPDFYYESSNINLSNTMPSQSPMIHTSLAYDHIGYSSSDSNVATVNNYGTIEYVGSGTCTVYATAYDSSNNVIANASVTVYCTQSKQMTTFQWYDSNNMSVSQYVVNLGGSGTEVFHYDATPADGWTVSGDNGTSIVLDTALKTLTIDKSSLSVRGNNAIVAQRAEDSSYYSGMNVFNVTVIPAGESANFYFQSQGVSLSPSFSTMSLMLNNNTGIDTMQYPINYSSSDTSVATVDNYGMVTYVGEGNAIITATLSDGNTTYTATATVEATVTYSNASVYYNNDPNQGQGFLDTNPYEIGLSNAGMQVNMSFEGPEYNINNASNDFNIVYDTNFSTPKAMDATIGGLTNTYSSGVNHIVFSIYADNVTMSEAGEQNRFILTFGHSGTNYLTDYIKFEFTGADS